MSIHEEANMAIDPYDEDLIRINEVPRHTPGGISQQTAWRWATKGVDGRVLETIKLAGRRWTSKSALRRFLAPQRKAVSA
jgi:hypothetical protein